MEEKRSQCNACKEKKRRCNGKTPCSACVKHKQGCTYTADSDRRRRKYHTDYIDYLETKSSGLMQFISEFVKDDSELGARINNRLAELKQKDTTTPELDVLQPRQKLEDHEPSSELLDGLLSDAIQSLSLSSGSMDRVKEDTPETSPLSPGDVTLDASSHPISQFPDGGLVFRSHEYRVFLLHLFERHFVPHSMLLVRLIPELRHLDYNNTTDPVIKFLLHVVYGVSSSLSDHEHSKIHEELFISLARRTFLGVISTSKVTTLLVAGIYTLSCYELGQGNLFQSYLIDTVSCSLSQHMGIHISYDADDRHKPQYAPRQTPLSSSALWSVCTHDRIITGSLNVPCVIHYKRIIAPFYHVVSNDLNQDMYIQELTFANVAKVWYIYDRYADQIFATQFDVGDTNNRIRVLSTALKTLKDFYSSLPSCLLPSSLDWTSGLNNNLFILIFNFNYHIVDLQLNKIFVHEAILNTKLATMSAAMKCGEIVSLLSQYSGAIDINSLPYYFPQLIGTVSYVLIFIITYEAPLQKIDKTQAKTYYRDCKTVLTAMSMRWRMPLKVLHLLGKMEAKHGVKLPEMPISLSDPPSSSSDQTYQLTLFDHLEFLTDSNVDQSFSWETEFPDFQQLRAQYLDPQYNGTEMQSAVPFQHSATMNREWAEQVTSGEVFEGPTWMNNIPPLDPNLFRQ